MTIVKDDVFLQISEMVKYAVEWAGSKGASPQHIKLTPLPTGMEVKVFDKNLIMILIEKRGMDLGVHVVLDTAFGEDPHMRKLVNDIGSIADEVHDLTGNFESKTSETVPEDVTIH